MLYTWAGASTYDGALLVTLCLEIAVVKRLPSMTFCFPAVQGLLVLHAHAENPVEAFGRMFQSAPRPPLMKTGRMEHRLVMHHLLVHADNAAAEGGYTK